MRIRQSVTSLPGQIDTEIFDSLGKEDSIVDRLLEMPASLRADPVDTGIARRLERVLAEEMRGRIEGQR